MTLISSPGLKGRPSSSQHCVDCRNTVCWSLNLHKVVRLHQPRRRLKTQQTFLRKADDAKELKRRRTKAKTATSSCRKLQSELTMRKAEYTTLLAVGMTWPPPLCRGSWAITASRILNLTFLMAESITKTNEFISALLVCGGSSNTKTWLTFITQGALPGSPLKPLNDAVFNRAEQRLVHLKKTPQRFCLKVQLLIIRASINTQLNKSYVSISAVGTINFRFGVNKRHTITSNKNSADSRKKQHMCRFGSRLFLCCSD